METVKIGVSGSRKGTTAAQKARFVEILPPELGELHHGDCIGSDEELHAIVRVQRPDTRIVAHPPDNPSRRAFVVDADEYREPLPYLDRNRHIVDDSDRLIATPDGFVEEVRSGTWYTVRYARSQGKQVTVIFPDGSIAES